MQLSLEIPERRCQRSRTSSKAPCVAGKFRYLAIGVYGLNRPPKARRFADSVKLSRSSREAKSWRSKLRMPRPGLNRNRFVVDNALVERESK